MRQEVLTRAEAGAPPSYQEIEVRLADEKPVEVKLKVEFEQPKKRMLTLPAPALPTLDPPSSDVDRINALFRQLVDPQQQVDCIIDLFKLLQRHDQRRCFLRLRQIAAGSA